MDLVDKKWVDSPCGDVLPKCVKVANDAIAVVTSPDVDLGDQTLAEIIEIFSGDQFTFVIPDEGSGTFDFFIEVAGPAVEANLATVTGFADDAALISALASGTNSIGFVSTVALNNGVNVVSIDGVSPSAAGGGSGYPFFRPLFMCFNEDAPEGKKLAVVQFICGVLGPVGQGIVADVGQIPLSSGEVSQERSELGCATIGVVC
eukprot:TRINITY_DN34390_c1_g1_i4.p2 TRINITY_DN34390_c1_g1~~TRINITY_DN34390_c1_g1_i4.p2  ORF type:complete len:204 (+),score=53.71 TRINITY_DN34390_c1_g1_i4:73-684(+)